MKRRRVTSTSIMSIGYDDATKILEVQFKSGIYQYFPVPKAVYKRFLVASSKGRFFNRFIKPTYDYAEVEG
ncbi:MAG: KTSC domain-containing protein [Verrucomicrobium sp.]